jgi:CRISPR-associated protein Cas1
MKQHLNSLFITTQGASLRKEGKAVVVRVEKQTKLRVPLHQLDSIACFGRVWASPQLLAACASSGVSVSLLSEYGRLLAAVVGFTSGNVLLRRQQYRVADDAQACLPIVRPIVAAKVANCRTVLMRALRDRPNHTNASQIKQAAQRLTDQAQIVMNCNNLDAIRGLEGEAAAIYFGAFNALITHEHPSFTFTNRSRRPPLDAVNAMLSFVYTLLAHDYRSACESVGLDSQCGFLHCDRPGRPSLALDLMEAFRPVLAERLVLSLINRQQVKPAGFNIQESGAVLMSDETRKAVLVAYQQRKLDQLRHPFVDEMMTLGLVPHIQARLLARTLRGDHDLYPEFIWR